MRIALVLLTALLVAASPASAATFGSDLAREPDAFITCDEDSTSCDGFNTTVPGNTLAYVVPFKGVATRWRTRIATGSTRLSITALAPAAGGTYTVRWRSTSKTAGTGVNEHRLSGTNHSVEPGNIIALHMDGDAEPHIGVSIPAATTRWLEVGPGGVTSVLDDSTYELAYNVDVEPDKDGDGYGDETEDTCPFDAGLHASSRCRVDVGVAATANPPAVMAGQQTTVNVTVANGGPSPVAPTVQWPERAPDQLMRSFTVVSTTAPCPLQLQAAAPACTLPETPGGGSLTLSAVLRAPRRVPGADARVAGSREVLLPIRVDDQPTTADTNTANKQVLLPIRVAWPDTAAGYTFSTRKSITRSALRRKGLLVTVRTVEPIRGRAVLYAKRGRRTTRLGAATWRIGKAGTLQGRIRVHRSRRAALRRATRVVIRLNGTDAAKNSVLRARSVRLRR